MERRRRGDRTRRSGVVAATNVAVGKHRHHRAGGRGATGPAPRHGCRGHGEPKGPPPEARCRAKAIELTFIQGVIGDEFYISMECGVQDAAARARRVTVDVQGPDAFDATLQNPIIDAVVASGPDAILVAPNDVEASAGPLQRAQDAGIQVILVDTSSTMSRSARHGSPRTTSRAA